MKPQSYNIVFLSNLYVVVSQMNVAMKKTKAVLLCKPFGKGVVLSADKDFSLTPPLQKFRRCGNRFYRSAQDKAAYMREKSI